MKLFRNIVRSIGRWADRYTGDCQEISPVPEYNISSTGVKSSRDHGSMGHGMNFTVFSAIGGKVVRFNHYDPRTDRENVTLYVVTDAEVLGEEIAQIITKESLSR